MVSYEQYRHFRRSVLNTFNNFYQHIVRYVTGLPGVGLLVGLEVVSEGEGEAAVLALEGLLPGVDQLVPLELGVLPEHTGAPGPVTPEDHNLQN